jgi:hypothetical protein
MHGAVMMVVGSSLGWIASVRTPLGHTTASVVAQRQCMLKEDAADTDTDVLMVLVRTLERIEAKIDYLEGKVDNLGAQGLEEKWRIERLEGKVRLGHTSLCDPQPRSPAVFGCRWIIWVRSS